MTTSDLTNFLLARIAEDEAGARMMRDREDGVAVPISHWRGVRFTDRMLAECEAKRRIIECAQEALAEHQIGTAKWLRVLHALAVPYADCDDYRDEWRP